MFDIDLSGTAFSNTLKFLLSMDWIKAMTTSARAKQTHKSILKRNVDSDERCINVTSSEYYKFWALFLAKEHVDYESLFQSISSLPERLRFAVYLKSLGRVEYVQSVEQNIEDPSLVDEVFSTCLKNPTNNEESIFNIYKTLESEFRIDSKVMIPLIHYFLSMESATESGTYSILYQLLREKGLFEAFAERKQDMVSDIWKLILSENYRVFTTLTDFIICLKDATYEQMFLKTIESTRFNKASDIVKVLASPANGTFYRSQYKKVLPAVKTRKVDQRYYDFLIVQNKLIEAQVKMKEEYTNRVAQLEEENRRLSEENEALKTKLKNIETQL